MSKLLTTDKERKDLSFLDWSSESIGNAVKDSAVKICQYNKAPYDASGKDLIRLKAAMLVVLNIMEKSNAETFTQEMLDVTIKEVNIGDYQMKVTKVKR